MLNSRGNPAVFDISHDEFVRLTMGRYHGTMRMKSIKGERYEKDFDLCAVIVLDTMYFYIVRQFGQQRQRIFAGGRRISHAHIQNTGNMGPKRRTRILRPAL